ncbi:unnamed protein product [Paramecium sonneborni]|uniref:phosphatidate phosphatase n=1 Tax=Paramecium sonneborni TaxID=65129 RepID=A0A8S1QDS3_9CILI|nr:unnamed protein product [Paramecium sonneborni]
MSSITQKIISKLDIRQYYLSGCIDIIVVQQSNGSLKSTPFHVRFGKYDGQDYQVDLIVNGNLTNVKMRLGKEGAAYFENSSFSSGYQSDDSCLDKISHLDETSSIFRQSLNYQKPDDLFNSDKKNSNWLQTLKFWQKGSNQKKESGVKIETINNLKEFQQEDTSFIGLSKIQLDKQNLQFQQQQQEKQIQTQDFENNNIAYSDKETLSPRQSVMELSLCGQQIQQQNLTQNQRLQLFEQHKVPYTTFTKDSLKIINNKDLVFKIGDKFFSREAGLIQLLAKQVYNQEMIIDSLDQQKKQNPQQQLQWYSVLFGKKKGLDQIEQNNNNSEIINNNEQTQKQHQQFKSQDRLRKMSEDSIDTQSTISIQRRRRQQRPILKPHSSILKQLGLRKGENKITYRLCIPKKNDIVELHGTIYLYDQKTKLVISDIDGTITKSDILGQLMPKLGTDWNHDGVANFYQNIQSMGYNIMYLTARAIGQADQTKEFIYNLQQQSTKLPKGPVILSPDSLFPAFKREIIDGTPELFKITALKEIRNLFIGESPFYCGFGNRITDSTAYQAVNVDISRIFIIDPKSDIHKFDTDEKTSYVELNKNIQLYFPPVDEGEYQSQNFWKIPIPDYFDINYS